MDHRNVTGMRKAGLRFATLLGIAAMLIAGWSTAEAANLISNPSFEQTVNGSPVDWVKGRWGTNTASFGLVTGSGGGNAARVEITSYTSGDAKWAFKHVPVTAGSVYRFQNDYQSTVSSHITVEFRSSSGATSYKDLASPAPSSGWSHTDVTFTAPSGAVSATVYHLVKQVGALTVDNYSLEATGDTTPPPPPPQNPPPQDPANLISNASFEGADSNGNPLDWTKGRWGTNTTSFDYPVSGSAGNRGARVKMTSYSTGDAKWVFKDVPVEAGSSYRFQNDYISNVPTYLTLRFKLANGTYTYPDLGLLPVAGGWQRTDKTFTAPSGAVSVTIFHLIKQVGELSVDNYSLTKVGTAPPPPPPTSTQGMVTLSFDDGWRSIYDNAIPILNRAGLKSSQYIITGRFAYPGYVNESEVLAMQSSGHEIGAHTVTHRDLAAIPLEEARTEIEKSKQDLLSIGVRSVTTLAYPFGSYNSQVMQLVANAGYKAARSTDNGYNQKGLLNTYALKRQPVNVNHSAAQVKQWIDYSIANNQWLILALHRVDYSGTTYSTTPETLQEIVDYLVQKNVKVVTMTEGYDMFK